MTAMLRFACERRRKQENMKEFGLDILRQLFGLSKARDGEIVFSRLTVSRMYEYQISGKTIQNIFRFGIEKKPGMIIQKFNEYSVGLYYKYDHAEDKYLITTCWKQ
jgi:hypothetical protein